MTPGHLKLFVGSALLCAGTIVGISWPVAAQAEAEAGAAGEPVVVYLVRHAEKADDGTTDPPLTVAGQIRVQTLKAILADASLTHVHSTDVERTRETARPIAEDAGARQRSPRIRPPDRIRMEDRHARAPAPMNLGVPNAPLGIICFHLPRKPVCPLETKVLLTSFRRWVVTHTLIIPHPEYTL